MRPIDADAVCRGCPSLKDCRGECWSEGECEIYDVLIKSPTLDLEPVRHGRWVFADPDWWASEVHCSVCGWGSQQVHPSTWMKYQGHNFCGNCGAKMDGGESDGT